MNMSSTINFEKILDISLDNFCWQNDAIIIAGPTCVGKSAIAVALAKQINGVILNADSVQVYKNLKILSARPSEEELQGIPHFLYGYVDGSNNFSVADWLFDLKTTLKKVQLLKKVPIIVGGSGLYINAVLNGLSKIPNVSEKNKKIKLFIQVNVGMEDQKSGIPLKDLDNFYNYCSRELLLDVVPASITLGPSTCKAGPAPSCVKRRQTACVADAWS